MTDRHRTYAPDDETLTKLETALQDADGVDLRSSIQGAIKERKAELRRERSEQVSA